MRTFDGIQRGHTRMGEHRSRSSPVSRPRAAKTSSRAFVFLTIAGLVAFFSLFRPNQAVESSRRGDQPTEPVTTTSNDAGNRSLPPQLTLPQGGGVGDSLEDLVILDQPTETSAPQPEPSDPPSLSASDGHSGNTPPGTLAKCSDSEEELFGSERGGVKGERTQSCEFTIRILNGGGKAGAAAALREKLTADGFTVSSIGNAQTTYAQTTVYYQEGKRLKAEQVVQGLGEPAVSFEQSTVASPADVLVVIGTDR